MKDKSVLFILEDGRFSGQHSYLVSLCKHLNKSSTSVLIPIQNSEESAEKYKKSEIDLLQIDIKRPSIKRNYLVTYILYFLVDVLKIRKIIKSNKYDCVYAAGGAWQIKGILAGILTRKKIIWHLNDSNTSLIIKIIFFFLSNFVDAIVYASKKTKKYYETFSSCNKSTIISSPIEDKFFLSENRSFSQENLKIVSVANINPVKNLEMLIDIASNFSEIKFDIIGPVYDSQKKYFAKLEKKIKDLNLVNFNFLGKKHDINSALMDYDVYICSSYFESSPISVREAMATGLPILSTDVGDVKELLLEGGGLICHNLEEFVLNLGKFLNGQLDFNSMSSKSSNFAKNNFTGIKCAEKHLELFNTISL